MNKLKEKIINGGLVLGVIGLGCVGLSLLEVFSKSGYTLKGYDRDPNRVNCLNRKENPFFNYPLENFFNSFEKNNVELSSEDSVLNDCDVLIISVPTPLDEYHNPNLSCIRSAFNTVAKYKKNQQLIILQSTTYPGTTMEELLPELQTENYVVGKDFYLSYVPEIVDPGNIQFSLTQIPRIVSGATENCLKIVETLYKKIGCKVIPCSTPAIAESAKLLQNSFRLVNISFINELKIMFDRMGIDIWEVLDVASSKPFGFVPFYPGPGVGGDCIPVDPFYLSWKGRKTNGPSSMLEQAGYVNHKMPDYVVEKTLFGLNKHCKCIAKSKILILGVTYKKDINIVHYSPAYKIIEKFLDMNGHVDFHDPLVDKITVEMRTLKSVDFDYKILEDYDATLILVDHSYYDWVKVVNHSHLVIDTRNVTKNIKTNNDKIFKA